MTAIPRPAFRQSRLSRLGTFALNGLTGSLLTALPVTALVALGWLTRHMGHTTRTRFGMAAEPPGWLLGPHESGRFVRALGGLGANVRTGLMSLTALLAWTLPFSILWLGSWWAGWENSFNKGYEQAIVGPSVFLSGTIIAILILPALPVMLAHLATEDRLSAAFDLRRLRSVVAQAGWRIPALAGLTLLLSLPFFAARGLMTTAPSFAPRPL